MQRTFRGFHLDPTRASMLPSSCIGALAVLGAIVVRHWTRAIGYLLQSYNDQICPTCEIHAEVWLMGTAPQAKVAAMNSISTEGVEW